MGLVSEEASWIGLGWSITPLYNISRTIIGIADETHNVGFLDYGSTIPSDLNVNDYTGCKS